jgi:hypothetical protein
VIRLRPLTTISQAIHAKYAWTGVCLDRLRYCRCSLGIRLVLAVAGLTDATILFTKHTRSSNQATDSASTWLRSLLGYGLALYVAVVDSGSGILLKPQPSTIDLAGSRSKHSTPQEMKRFLDKMREAARGIDRLRSSDKTSCWGGAKEIRKWRDAAKSS